MVKPAAVTTLAAWDTLPMLIAYYRVSTDRHGKSRLGLEAQQYAVEAFAKRTGQKITASFTEIESGRRRDHPKLAEALATWRTHGLTLVVAKLDRLARDVSLILSLVDSGVRIVFLDPPDLSADPIVGRLVLTVLGDRRVRGPADLAARPRSVGPT
jgi:DNA invertase Pin-like site-specific DNA recombinase